jgi:hypothetical protein
MLEAVDAHRELARPVAAATGPAAVRRAAVRATLAWSTRDTEPWWLVVGPGTCELHADPDRWLPAQDPVGRSLTLSIGCALFNARASLDADGAAYRVERLPDPTRQHHLATITLLDTAGPGTDDGGGLAALAAGGFDRSTIDPFVDWPLQADEVERLAGAVRAEGAVLHRLEPDVVVVATAENRALDWLTAGEAVQRLVLEAAVLGFAVGEVVGGLELPRDRARLRERIGGLDHPQAVLRLGALGGRIRGRRRPLAEVLH